MKGLKEIIYSFDKENKQRNIIVFASIIINTIFLIYSAYIFKDIDSLIIIIFLIVFSWVISLLLLMKTFA